MSQQLMDALAETLAAAEAAACRVLIVTGAGEKSFCSGGDLKERNGMTEAQWRAQHAIFEEAIYGVMNSLVPVMSLNFNNAPIGLAIQTYVDFMHKEVVNLHENSVPLWYTITLVQITPLSREEIGYALKTLIEWNSIRMAPEGEGKLKLERIPSR